MTTDPRDAARDRWNAALASGDDDRIERVGREVLDDIHRRQLNDWNVHERTGREGAN